MGVCVHSYPQRHAANAPANEPRPERSRRQAPLSDPNDHQHLRIRSAPRGSQISFARRLDIAKDNPVNVSRDRKARPARR